MITVAGIDGTDVRALIPRDGYNYYGAAWSPDGNQLVYQETDGTVLGIAHVDGGTVRIVDVATGESTSVAEGHTVEG